MTDALAHGPSCLTLVCPLALEQSLHDLLDSQDAAPIYSSTPAFLHGTAHTALDSTERVLGRQHAVQLQLLLDPTTLPEVIECLERAYPTGALMWWTVKTSAAGMPR